MVGEQTIANQVDQNSTDQRRHGHHPEEPLVEDGICTPAHGAASQRMSSRLHSHRVSASHQVGGKSVRCQACADLCSQPAALAHSDALQRRPGKRVTSLHSRSHPRSVRRRVDRGEPQPASRATPAAPAAQTSPTALNTGPQRPEASNYRSQPGSALSSNSGRVWHASENR